MVLECGDPSPSGLHTWILSQIQAKEGIHEIRPEDTHAAIPPKAPGWSLLWSEQPETLSSEFPQQLATAGFAAASSSEEGAPPRNQEFQSQTPCLSLLPIRASDPATFISPTEKTGTKARSPSMHMKHPFQKGLTPSSKPQEGSTHLFFSSSLSS